MCLDSSWRLRQARGSRTGGDWRRRQCPDQATAVLPVSWSAMVPALASAHTAAAARWVPVQPLADFQAPAAAVDYLIPMNTQMSTRQANGDIGGRGGAPRRTKGPAANLEKRRVDSPDCQDAGPRNLILHDQPESRRSRIGHESQDAE